MCNEAVVFFMKGTPTPNDYQNITSNIELIRAEQNRISELQLILEECFGYRFD